MIREDDFAKRRVEKGIADLTDEQLYDKFWEMCSKVVDLLRMGVSSLDTQKIVEGAIDRGLMGHGTGHIVYRISKDKGISIREASAALAQGEYWDDAVAIFSKEGK